MSKASFGSIRQRSSGRYQARYTGPDGVMYSAPITFVRKGDASIFLAGEALAISAGTWVAPPLRNLPADVDPRTTLTFADYSATWLAGRRTKNGEPLTPRTRGHYRDILDRSLVPTFGAQAVRSITRLQVRQWHAAAYPDAPTYRAHAYSLLRTILNTAVEDEVIDVNPCTIKGAASVKTKRALILLTEDQYALLVKAMPDRLQAMVVLATWTALRFGELAELRRGDVEMGEDSAVLRIRRGVTRTKGAVHRGKPKSEAGVRDVTVPPHVVPVLAAHLREHTGPGAVDLLFPASDGVSNMSPNSLYWHWYPARDSIGRGDLRFHDLRHTGAVLAAQAGATIADLMARLGHSTADMAIRYQHTGAERDALIAAEMSRRASGW